MEEFSKWLKGIKKPRDINPTLFGQGKYDLYYDGVLRRRTDSSTIASLFSRHGWKVIDTSKTSVN